MRVLIRADASLRIGFGHVMRCLTLADALRDSGCEVLFACAAEPGNALQLIADRGFSTCALPGGDLRQSAEAPLPWAADIAALWVALDGAGTFDWCIVDHYGLGADWQRAVRARARQVMVIDDLANRDHDADLLLDQNLTASNRAYAGRLPAPCQSLLGTRFALLRPEFFGGPIELAGEARRVVVSFGGVDPTKETLKAMEALQGLPALEVDFVAGAANPAWDELVSRCEGQPNWRLHRHLNDFAELLRRADLCIGAGGATSWERAVLGIPTLCIALAENQRPNAEALAEAGAHLYLGESSAVTAADLRAAVQVLAGNLGLRRSLAARSRALVDGMGVGRVLCALLAPALTLRPASLADARLLFEGRNAEPVRQASLSREPVSWEGHLHWLEGVLASERRWLLVAELADGPVGVLRYDRLESRPDTAEVSIYLLPGRAGVGWGHHLLAAGEKALRAHWPDLGVVEAQVRPDNAASLALFARAGYQQEHCLFRRPLPGENP
ncbi:UDP-2,4-diacetamido-2,4,6-trideoxy-beta-L-altropyranose hydrolase [Pseudomonas solani]|uniref:UDP-2,4-diacetamido-2,4, 6-trideoxy-beta-L-altropyranose hydrolase n=1 Tax=Pseudomonas solani TaxID=2731552 RepID=UPI003D6C4240